MIISRIRTTTSDGLILNGLRYSPDAQPAIRLQGSVIHFHGMSGGPLLNPWTQDIAEALTAVGWELLCGETRGSAILSYIDSTKDPSGYVLGGAATELVSDAPSDADAWAGVAWGEALILEGHSLGATKALVAAARGLTDQRDLLGLILLSPTDMVAWTQRQPGSADMLEQATREIAAGRPSALLTSPAGAMPITAATLYERAARGRPADAINSESPSGHTPLDGLDLPVLCVMGDADPDMGDNPKAHLEVLGSRCPNQTSTLIAGADHPYFGYERELAGHIQNWVVQLSD